MFVLTSWFNSLKPVSGALTDLVTETGCATATGLAEGTAGAAVATVTGGSSASTASTATSAKWGTIPSLCALVHLNTHTHEPSRCRISVYLLWAFIQKASTPLTECHPSCKTCTGPTNQDCDECKEGWEEDDQEACVGKTTSVQNIAGNSISQWCLVYSNSVWIQRNYELKSVQCSNLTKWDWRFLEIWDYVEKAKTIVVIIDFKK